MATPDPFLLSLVKDQPLPNGFRITMPLVDSAYEHGIAPLLAEAVERRDLEGDHDALVRLTMWSLDSAAGTRAAEAAIPTLLDACEAIGVEPAAFKGITIGRRWYARPELRPAFDVDIFLSPGDTDRLVDLIAMLGDEEGIGQVVEDMIAEERIFEYSVYVDGVCIDIHRDPWNLLLAAKQQDTIWERTELIQLPDGRSLRVLDLEMSILMALVHLLRDNFADLMHLSDVDRMIDASPDWEFIASFAEEEGWTDLVRFGLGFVCDTFGRPSPLPRRLTPLARVFLALLWPQRVLLRGTGSVVKSHRRQFFSSLLVSGRRRNVAEALFRRVFPPRSMIDYRYPGCDCPYLIALYRWRRSQHQEYGVFRSRALGFREELAGIRVGRSEHR